MVEKIAEKLTAAKATLACLLAAIGLLTAAAPPSWSASPGSVPGASTSLKLPPMVPEHSTSFFIPSSSAPDKGLAVNVIYPVKPRYADGAPVVVVVPGGDEKSGLDFSMHAAQAGFVEVRFAFPGGGKEGFRSGGTYDQRGPLCEVALRDVIKFAAGKSNDTKLRTINELVPVKVNSQNMGIVGWSNGGNLLMTTLDKYHSDLRNVSWLAFYETPLGSMFYPPALGSAKDFVTNRHYRQGSAATGEPAVDYRRMKFQADASKTPGSHKKVGLPEIPGVVFFDENNNGVWEESIEFAVPYSSMPAWTKQIYPPQVTRALARLNVFGKTWNPQVATIEESELYFKDRDGSLHLKSVAKAMPHLMVTVFGSRLDHLQHQPDHPHVSLQYNDWATSGVKWVRLNPDPLYVSQVVGMNARNFPNNVPNESIDASDIESYLEPEGMVPDFIYMDAAIAEMADRKKQNKINAAPLAAPLTSYNNGAAPPPTAADDKQPEK